MVSIECGQSGILFDTSCRNGHDKIRIENLRSRQATIVMDELDKRHAASANLWD
jgi:hypothetical protein